MWATDKVTSAWIEQSWGFIGWDLCAVKEIDQVRGEESEFLLEGSRE